MTTTQTPAEAVATLRGVAKIYGEGPTAVRALRDIDLDIQRGSFVVVLGPSGSGKTTLLNVLGAIEPATAGTVAVDGQQLTGLDSGELTELRRQSLGFVFQFFNLVPTLTARENVMLIAELTGGVDEARVDEVLAQVELTDRVDHFPGQLSGGQQQRVAIARALVKAPPLLLCDEPTGALDAETGRTVIELLQHVARTDGRTVIVVTHNVVVGDAADRVLVMRSGEIVEDRVNEAPVAASEIGW